MARENKKLEQLETSSVELAIQSEQAAVVVGKEGSGAVATNATGKGDEGKGVEGVSEGKHTTVTNADAANDSGAEDKFKSLNLSSKS